MLAFGVKIISKLDSYVLMTVYTPVLKMNYIKSRVVEATKMWVCRLLSKSKFLKTTLDFYQIKEPKGGCAAAHPAHPLPLPLQG